MNPSYHHIISEPMSFNEVRVWGTGERERMRTHVSYITYLCVSDRLRISEKREWGTQTKRTREAHTCMVDGCDCFFRLSPVIWFQKGGDKSLRTRKHPLSGENRGKDEFWTLGRDRLILIFSLLICNKNNFFCLVCFVL